MGVIQAPKVSDKFLCHKLRRKNVDEKIWTLQLNYFHIITTLNQGICFCHEIVIKVP